MSIINNEVSDFKTNAFHAGEFKTVSKEDILGKKRSKEIADARHISIFLIRELTDMSYPSISKIFEKDHSTIMHSYDKMKKKVEEGEGSSQISLEISELKKEITG